jgi:hypothetical protein
MPRRIWVSKGMMIARVGLLLLISVVVACGETETNDDSAESKLRVKQWRGEYTGGHEAQGFCPCQSDACYWAVAQPEVLAQFEAFIEQHGRYPYEPIYIEFTGQLLDKPREGFALDYDGLIAVGTLSELRRLKSSDCR